MCKHIFTSAHTWKGMSDGIGGTTGVCKNVQENLLELS